MLPSRNENSEGESNLMPHAPYLYLSRPVLFVSFTDSNQQLHNVKSVFKFRNCASSVEEIYKLF